MRINYTGKSETGHVRAHNEDNLYVDGKCREPEINSFVYSGEGETDKAPAAFAVCDGIGGGIHGEIASSIVTHRLKDNYQELDSGNILPMIMEVNRDVCRELRIREGMEVGTTFAGLLLQQNHYVIWNVGDSRVYLLRDGVLQRLTKDHTEAQQMLEMGFISEETAETISARHALTQYVGVPEEDFLLSPQILESMEMMPGDRFLLCSDGLYEMVGESQIQAVMQTAKDPQETADLLTDTALTAGGIDNITAIVVHVMK